MSTKLADTALRMSRADIVSAQIDAVIAVGDAYQNMLRDLYNIAHDAGITTPSAIGDVIDDIHNMREKLNDLRNSASVLARDCHNVIESTDKRDVIEHLKALPPSRTVGVD